MDVWRIEYNMVCPHRYWTGRFDNPSVSELPRSMAGHASQLWGSSPRGDLHTNHTACPARHHLTAPRGVLLVRLVNGITPSGAQATSCFRDDSVLVLCALLGSMALSIMASAELSGARRPSRASVTSSGR